MHVLLIRSLLFILSRFDLLDFRPNKFYHIVMITNCLQVLYTQIATEEEENTDRWHHPRDEAHRAKKVKRQFAQKCEIVPSSFRLFLCNFFPLLLLLFSVFHILFLFGRTSKKKLHAVFIAVSVGVEQRMCACACVLSFTDHRFSLEFVEQ